MPDVCIALKISRTVIPLYLHFLALLPQSANTLKLLAKTL